MSEEEIRRYQVDIANQIDGKITCPRCRWPENEPDEDQQKLIAYDEYPGELFCPHCEMSVTFGVVYDPLK